LSTWLTRVHRTLKNIPAAALNLVFTFMWDSISKYSPPSKELTDFYIDGGHIDDKVQRIVAVKKKLAIKIIFGGNQYFSKFDSEYVFELP
jgi:hypothetical protein